MGVMENDGRGSHITYYIIKKKYTLDLKISGGMGGRGGEAVKGGAVWGEGLYNYMIMHLKS